LPSGSVECWGWNKYGELGVGYPSEAHTPVQTKHFTGLVRAGARLAVSTLGADAHNLKVKFPGDTLHNASSATLTQTVN
jgi:alpha-tubulin suppressor-like RCC1 family protein